MKKYKSKKEFKSDLLNLSAIEIYKNVLAGKYIKRFPTDFWKKPEALDNANKIIIYLIEEKLKLTDDELKKELSAEMFKDTRLYSMLHDKFNNSPYDAINSAYPNKFKRWEFNRVANNYWDKETSKEAVIWLIEEKLKLNIKDIKNISNLANLFIDNGLIGMVSSVFNGSTYDAINNAYPNTFKK